MVECASLIDATVDRLYKDQKRLASEKVAKVCERIFHEGVVLYQFCRDCIMIPLCL